MKKMFLLFGVLAMVGVLFVACSEQDPTSPEEAAFAKNKVSYDCEIYGLQEELDALNTAAEAIFMTRPSLKGVLSNTDNTARKVCTDNPNYQAALEQYYELETLVNGQNPSKLDTSLMSAEEFLVMAYSFATGVEYEGLVHVVQSPDEIPEEGLDLIAGSFEGAVRIFPGTFAEEDFPVTIVEYRLPDDYTGGDSYSFGEYADDLLPEIWWFDASAQPVAEFEAWVCLVDDPNDPFLYDRVVMAHAKDDGTVELLPKLPEGDSPLNCGGAVIQTALGPTAPGWLQFAGNVVRPVLNEIFGVKKLNAMYFAGKGLGGRGTSFSPHAGVENDVPDPIIDFVLSELNLPSPGTPGTYFNRYTYTTTNWAQFSPSLFELTDAYGPCGGNSTPSRTWLEIYDASDDQRLFGFCAFDSPDDLQSFWFSTPAGQAPPDIYIELWDRAEDVRYRSNTVVILTIFNTLTVAGAGTGSGTVTRPNSTGFDINCQITAGAATGDCAHTAEEWVIYGTLVPTPDAGSTFTGWTGACTGTGGCSVNMDSDKTATATFTADVVVDHTLEVSVIHDGGAGTVTDGIVTCDVTASPCTWTYAEGTSVTLTGTAVSGDAITTVIFDGDCAGNSGTSTATCNLSMLGDRTTGVYFTIGG